MEHGKRAGSWALGVAVLLGATPLARAQSIGIRHGNVFLNRTQFTTGGTDTAPALSPDRKWVVFVRATPGQTVATGAGDEQATELHLLEVRTRKSNLLVRGHASDAMQKVLANFTAPQFAPNGRTVYFMSSAWATSGTIHAVDLASRKEHFVCAGNDLRVVQHGKYRGDLIVQQHRYRKHGGAYDSYYLMRPDGKEIRTIGTSLARRLN